MHPAVRGDGILHEAQADLCQRRELRCLVGLAHEHDERASDIVDAVAVFATGDREERVFEDTVLIAQCGEVGVGR